jgi:hypothetical protein
MILVIVIRNALGIAVSYEIKPRISGIGTQNCFVNVAIVSFAYNFTLAPIIFYRDEITLIICKDILGICGYERCSSSPSESRSILV